MSEADPSRAEPTGSVEQRVSHAQAGLQAEAKALARLASALAPLSRPKSYADLEKLPALIAKVEAKATALPGVAERGLAVIEMVKSEVQARRQRLRENLARELREACEARGLSLRVVRREEPIEVRIPPLAVAIDREKGQAEVRFAKRPLEASAAEAEAILDAHERALARLRAGFDAERFFQACHKAWLAARAASHAGNGERVEILDFLPYLALQLQKPAFRVEPSAKNFQDYPRARFAWDVLRLRRESGLARDGWRLNLGVATGTTASQKRRVIWFEDENGEGEYKLTVFFTRAEGGS